MPYISPNVLIVLDGLGISDANRHNAFNKAHTPHLTRWKTEYSYTTLQAAGTFVGLPDGYNGNSEVGHFTLGSGKIILQISTLLNHMMQESTLNNSAIITKLLKNFKVNSRVHLLGLASDGNIHSNIAHARALISTLNHHKIKNILFHAIVDGRDTPPCSAQQFLDTIESDLQKYKCGKIATIHGRFYAMDRNQNLDRTNKSLKILTQQEKTIIPYGQAIKNNYAQGLSDEFLVPTACIQDHIIQPGDGVIFFNFRPDRAIQLTKKLLEMNLAFLVTPVQYHPTLLTTTLLPSVQTNNTLLEILSAHHKKIFTIAETEKYAHVTYFFNGHKDITLPGEQRVLIPSLTDPDIAKNPKMQAEKITQTIIDSLHNNPCDFYLVNYANADMIGHSGNFNATVAAIECLDHELGKLYKEIVIKQNGTMFITADHGNAEKMFDEKSGQSCTSHTKNPVPFYMLKKNHKQEFKLTGLADVAPFILKMMNITSQDEKKQK